MGALEENQYPIGRIEVARRSQRRNTLPGGLTAESKRALLRRFLTEIVTDRTELLAILRLDWREVAPVLCKSRRKSRPEQMQALAAALQKALDAQRIAPETLPEAAQDLL